ncbi:MAG: molybdopterin biosynthesis protein [Synergistetes bacterium]|nr:molybdopterin biosynthesis protein [Synergistota bacterium]MCX8128212.1 molybdopterin biosynthesis protein [Synergistota bacterium]MDW8192659.1 molybdopterin biosynthesis protein [Synergistota bacterium]
MEYLKRVLPREEALKCWLSSLNPSPIGEEKISLKEALGRVTSRAVFATISSPPLKLSGMDGFALRSCQTVKATENNPVIIDDYIPVNTGFPITQEYDAVLPKEEALFEGTSLKILRSLRTGENIRFPGESFSQGELLLESCRRIGFQELQLIAASGINELWVWKKPKVCFIPVGNELAPIGEELKNRLAYESNSLMLEALIKEWGGDVVVKDILHDDYEEILNSLRREIDSYDIVIIGAGSSKGEKDFTAEVIAALGEIVVEGIACKPGKPLILGKVKEKPVVGLPGYPVSAWVGLNFFVNPLISAYLGVPPFRPDKIEAYLSKGLVSTEGIEEVIRVRLGKVSGRWVAVTLPRGAGNISSLGKADGYALIPRNVIELERGSKIEVNLLRKREELEGTILFIGSHDLSLDIISDEISKLYPGFRFVSVHIGSLGGLFALKNREAHISGIHLFDDKAEKYNIPYIEKHLTGEAVEIIKFLYREQGLMVKPGNPKRIKSLLDLTREDIVFVNRQRGSGTRILFDYLLKKEGISSSSIKGYDDEEFTHLGVAIRVASGNADVGIGIYSAAKILGLDFIPLFEEEYDLITLKEHLVLPQVRILLDILDSPSFKNRVLSLGGYRWAR